MSFVKMYSVVEYKDSGEINTTLYDLRGHALQHIQNFAETRENPLNVCGLDELLITTNTNIRDNNGEVTYEIDVTRIQYDVDDHSDD